MAPAFKDGQVVIVRRTRKSVPAGSVVMVRHAGVEKIKRITRVSLDKIYVEGDNGAHSTDSRHFGWLRTQDIVGIVIWPRNNFATQKYPA